MNLVLVEEIGQIDEALRLVNQNAKIVAFSPKVLYALEKRNVRFCIPEDYYDNAALQKEWVKYFDLSKTIISEVDKFLHDKTNNFSCQVDIRPLAFNAQMFMNMFRQVVIDIFILKEIFKKEEPTKVFYPKNRADNLTYRLDYEQESIISYLVPLFASSKFIAECYEWREHHLGRISRVSLRNLSKSIVMKIIDTFSFKSYGTAIMVFCGGYDLDYILPLLKKNGYRIYHFDKIIKRYSRSLSMQCYKLCFENNSAGLTKYFEYGGINFFPVVESRMKFYLDQIFPGYMGMYSYIKMMLRKLRIRLLIGGHSPSRVYENILCAAAKELGVKTLSFQHGAYGERFNHILHINDLDNVMNDYFFAWGDGVRNYAHKYNLNRVKIISVGSAWMDKLTAKNRLLDSGGDYKKTILYMPTSLRVKPKNRMLPGEFMHNKYFLLQRRIISEVSKSNNITLLVKLHPNDHGSNPISDFIKESRIKNCITINRGLVELLPKVDLVISDFMSTALVQLSAMKKNVMFYIEQSALLLEPDAMAALDKAMYCFNQLEDFLEAVSVYAISPENFPIKESEEFLSRYGTHQNDGKSAERVLESIDKILSGAI